MFWGHPHEGGPSFYRTRDENRTEAAPMIVSFNPEGEGVPIDSEEHISEESVIRESDNVSRASERLPIGLWSTGDCILWGSFIEPQAAERERPQDESSL